MPIPFDFPKRIRDWRGGYVRLRRSITTRGGLTAPAGTVCKITHTGARLRLETLPCAQCGVKFQCAVGGDRRVKVQRLEWLGFDFLAGRRNGGGL